MNNTEAPLSSREWVPESIPTEELVMLIVDLARQQGGARATASKALNPKTRNQQWAIATAIEKRLPELIIEAYKRMGVQVPAEISNKPAFIYLAASRHNRLCETPGCGQGGGAGVKFLNWVVADGTPLALIQAHNGAGRESLQKTVQLSRLLCRKCAMKVGTKFLKSGKPDLKEWR